MDNSNFAKMKSPPSLELKFALDMLKMVVGICSGTGIPLGRLGHGLSFGLFGHEIYTNAQNKNC